MVGHLKRRMMAASIASIQRGLRNAFAISALLWVVFLVLGVTVLAVACFLATVIAFGLIVVALAWRLITEAHPDSG
jgi:hypothetical protein